MRLDFRTPSRTYISSGRTTCDTCAVRLCALYRCIERRPEPDCLSDRLFLERASLEASCQWRHHNPHHRSRRLSMMTQRRIRRLRAGYGLKSGEYLQAFPGFALHRDQRHASGETGLMELKDTGQNGSDAAQRPKNALRPLCYQPRTLSRGLFPNRFRLGEQQKIIRPARLRVCSRHVEPAERMRTHDCSCALAIDVQVADVELLLGHSDFVLRRGIDRAGQAELSVVGNRQPIFEIA